MKQIKFILTTAVLALGMLCVGCGSSKEEVGIETAETVQETCVETDIIEETVAETTVLDTLEDLSDLIYAERQNIIDRFGEPNEVIFHESELDAEYNFNELIYDDLIFYTDAGGEHEAVNYIKIVTTENKYSFYGIYLGMPEEELKNNLDGRLTLYTDMEFTDDPFDDGDVTYRILNYDAFAMIKLDNGVVSQIEYLFPIV